PRRQDARQKHMGGRAGSGDVAAHGGRRHPGKPLRAIRNGDPMDQATLSRTHPGAAARAPLWAALALLAGCASQATLPASLDGDLVRATPLQEKSERQPPQVAAELVPPDDPEVQAAMRAWKAGQSAPIIRT